MFRQYWNNDNFILFENLLIETDFIAINRYLSGPINGTIGIKPIGQLIVGYAF